MHAASAPGSPYGRRGRSVGCTSRSLAGSRPCSSSTWMSPAPSIGSPGSTCRCGPRTSHRSQTSSWGRGHGSCKTCYRRLYLVSFRPMKIYSVKIWSYAFLSGFSNLSEWLLFWYRAEHLVVGCMQTVEGGGANINVNNFVISLPILNVVVSLDCC